MISRELQFSSVPAKTLLDPLAHIIDGYVNPTDQGGPHVRWTLTIEDTRAHVADTVTNETKEAL